MLEIIWAVILLAIGLVFSFAGFKKMDDEPLEDSILQYIFSMLFTVTALGLVADVTVYPFYELLNRSLPERARFIHDVTCFVLVAIPVLGFLALILLTPAIVRWLVTCAKRRFQGPVRIGGVSHE